MRRAYAVIRITVWGDSSGDIHQGLRTAYHDNHVNSGYVAPEFMLPPPIFANDSWGVTLLLT
jgi:hypothetical protein